MSAIQNLALSRKLMLAFAVMVCATAGLGGLVVHELGAIDTVREAGRTATARLDALSVLGERLAARETAAAAVLRPAADPEAAARLAGANAAVARALAELPAEGVDATETSRLARLGTLDADYRGETDDIARRLAAPQTRAEAEKALAASRGQAAMLSLTGALAETARAERQAASTAIDVAYGRLPSIVIACVLGSLALAGLLCLLLVRGIAAPVRHVAEALTKLSAGDADVTLKMLGRRDEIGRMAAALDVFRQNLLANRSLEAEAAKVHAASLAEHARAEDERESIAADQALVVDALEEALTRMSSGDLTARISTPFPGRYARLGDEFNKAAAHLHDMVGRVAASVSSIANGTNEIGHASDDLSRRTEQQAASLDKTASALGEITATVKHSAENAASVASSVATARQDTERSGEVMLEAVAAMTAIQKSSQQIARIIGVIDEIAFQTNLLALNAGVEAARAGDAGRGFAVVALEVRALAQRSSEAAKEIKTLIGASSTQVGNGVDLVNRSGEVLTRIAAQVTQIDALVQEIAGSAREQSIGIADVNDAVNKMDRVTQQNAAMVEETTAATLSLRTETEELGRLVASFRVDTTDLAVQQLRGVAAVMKTPAASAPRAAVPSPVQAHAPTSPIAAPRASAAAAPATAAAEELGWEEF
ncbi:methyl-accepting chemotaxis protein [Aureimonas pseudogalii]|uniref:Methyl-accepting chemotaxis protein n=1 Tax=Aureimonas pseudogalii TaxID=1744844 RepID=A0A7W6H6V2_9HYPH|nr:methyl-accepting chemotaxis protein [Aureimonas pseudogalii]MBB3999631.1 methyl-accepting chemotaxis protein [Aureimonas pseudogalii]